VFCVISVYFNINNILPKSGTFLRDSLYIYRHVWSPIFVKCQRSWGGRHWIEGALKICTRNVSLFPIKAEFTQNFKYLSRYKYKRLNLSSYWDLTPKTLRGRLLIRMCFLVLFMQTESQFFSPKYFRYILYA